MKYRDEKTRSSLKKSPSWEPGSVKLHDRWWPMFLKGQLLSGAGRPVHLISLICVITREAGTLRTNLTDEPAEVERNKLPSRDTQVWPDPRRSQERP